jgi:glutamine amidotransferase
MCRWFAYISATEPCLLEDVLITPKHSLVKQVSEHYLPGLTLQDPHNYYRDPLVAARNSFVNIDGFGVAWYTSSAADFESGDSKKSGDGTVKEGLRPAAYKTIQPPINDINFRSICANTETRVCFAHIRAASGTPITNVNNHPFTYGKCLLILY